MPRNPKFPMNIFVWYWRELTSRRLSNTCDHLWDYSGGTYSKLLTLFRVGPLSLSRCDMCKAKVFAWSRDAKES